MSAKEIVRTLYSSDLAKDDVMNLFHQDCQVKWHSTKGFKTLNYDGIDEMLKGIKQSFHSFSYRISHLLDDNGFITARYTVYATSIERDEKEDPIAHFISIWETKDGKLYKGYEISQQVDNTPESLNSFAEIKA